MKIPVPYDAKNMPVEWRSFFDHYNQLVAYILQENKRSIELDEIKQKLLEFEKTIKGENTK